jgi:hypothetical protein
MYHIAAESEAIKDSLWPECIRVCYILQTLGKILLDSAANSYGPEGRNDNSLPLHGGEA